MRPVSPVVPTDEERLSQLARRFRSTRRDDERQKIAGEYAEIVNCLIEGGHWNEMPPPEDQLPDKWMPPAFADCWSNPAPTAASATESALPIVPTDEERLGQLAFQFRGTRCDVECRRIADDYAETVARLRRRHPKISCPMPTCRKSSSTTGFARPPNPWAIDVGGTRAGKFATSLVDHKPAKLGLMPRRFQFSLRALLTLMLAVAIACAIWIRLPVAVKMAIVGAPAAVLMWLYDWWLFEVLIDALLPGHGPSKPENGPKYVIKWRRRGEEKSRE